jgi:hypothetical protein
VREGSWMSHRIAVTGQCQCESLTGRDIENFAASESRETLTEDDNSVTDHDICRARRMSARVRHCFGDRGRIGSGKMPRTEPGTDQNSPNECQDSVL